MARAVSTDALRAQIAASMPDNVTQQISPADVRGSCQNMVDTFAAAYAAMIIGTPATQSVGTTPIDFTFFDTIPPGTVFPELTANTTTGLIAANVPMVMDVQFTITFQVGSSENLIGVIHDGSGPTLWRGEQEGNGGSDPAVLVVRGLVDCSVLPQSVKLVINNQSGTSTYDFTAGGVLAQLVPLRTTPP